MYMYIWYVYFQRQLKRNNEEIMKKKRICVVLFIYYLDLPIYLY